jgi:hypothetical protein
MNDRLLMFHAICGLKDCARLIEPLDVVVFARHIGSTLTLFDIVGETLPTVGELYPFLSQPSDEHVALQFSPDALGVLDGATVHRIRRHNLHLSPGAPLDEPYIFPWTAHA